MKNYTVTVRSKLYGYTEVEVEAEGEKEAKERAMELFSAGECDATEVDWDSSSEEEVVDVEEQ
jgi:hypothetical protein